MASAQEIERKLFVKIEDQIGVRALRELFQDYSKTPPKGKIKRLFALVWIRSRCAEVIITANEQTMMMAMKQLSGTKIDGTSIRYGRCGYLHVYHPFQEKRASRNPGSFEASSEF